MHTTSNVRVAVSNVFLSMTDPQHSDSAVKPGIRERPCVPLYRKQLAVRFDMRHPSA
jgi:hypothetical protein